MAPYFCAHFTHDNSSHELGNGKITDRPLFYADSVLEPNELLSESIMDVL